MKTTPNISKIRLHSLAAILSRPRLKRSGERRSLLTLLLLIALTAAAFFLSCRTPAPLRRFCRIQRRRQRCAVCFALSQRLKSRN